MLLEARQKASLAWGRLLLPLLLQLLMLPTHPVRSHL
jgi:hypothetical protein